MSLESNYRCERRSGERVLRGRSKALARRKLGVCRDGHLASGEGALDWPFVSLRVKYVVAGSYKGGLSALRSTRPH